MATATKPKPKSSRAGKKPDDWWIRTKPASATTKGYYVIRWIETHCVFTTGRWIGKPFRLLMWQKLFILALFAVGADGLRVIRWALLGVPKKNGKTELAAALALYFMVGDGEPAPLVVCAAASDDQADLVFNAARTMAEMSPTLSEILEPFEREILFRDGTPGKIRRVAAAAGTNDGPSISVVIIDELHEWVGTKGENVWNVLTNAGGAREQPLVLQITTAGFDQETICYRQYEHGKAVAEGKVADPRYLFHWIEPPEKADWKDPATWAKANPSWGVVMREEFYADQITKKPENVFKRYFLNQWTSAAERWIPMEVWDENAGPAIIEEGAEVWVAVDGAAKRDTTAVITVARDGEGGFHVVADVFEPPGDGGVIDPGLVEEHVRELTHRYDVREIAFDPALYFRSAQLLAEEGLPMVEFPQTHNRMCPAAQCLFDAVMEHRLHHGGDRMLRAHADAAVARQVGYNGGWRLDKVKATQHIDAVVALAMAVMRATESTGGTPGVMVI